MIGFLSPLFDTSMLAVISLLASTNRLLYYVPLIVVVSLVYGATRHELMAPILRHAVRCAISITGFMLAILLVIAAVGWAL